MTLNSEIITEISGPRESFENLVSKRVCWLSHINLWWNFTQDHVKSSTDLARYIPCHGNGHKCKYVADMEGRITGKDPGIVCPIFSNNPQYIDTYEKTIMHFPLLDHYRNLIR